MDNAFGSLKALCLSLSLFFGTSTTAFAKDGAVQTLRLSTGVGLVTLDPLEAEDYATVRVLMNLGEGLSNLDNQLNPIEGLAKWSWSEKNKTYTFSLKKRFWSDSSPLSVDDFMRAFRRLLDPKTKAKLGFPLIEVIKNGREFKSGKLTNWEKVGIKKVDDQQFAITLNHPAPFVLKLLALPFAFPIKREGPLTLEAPSIGPMILEELKLEQYILLKPNPFSPNAPNFKVRFLAITESSVATHLFDKKELDVVDGLSGPEVIRYKKSEALRDAPFSATYYIGFNLDDPLFSKLEVRRALAKAIDGRDLASVVKPAQRPSQSFVATPLEGSDFSFEFGPETENSTAFFRSLKIINPISFYFDQQEKNNLIAQRLSFLLKKKLDVTLKLESFEWKTYLNKLFKDKPGFFRFAWLAPFADPLAHLQVFYSTNPNNPSRYNNPKYDQLVDQIAATAPGKKRKTLINEAQKILLKEDVVILPIYHYTQYYLVSDRWQEVGLTPMGILFPYRARPKP